MCEPDWIISFIIEFLRLMQKFLASDSFQSILIRLAWLIHTNLTHQFLVNVILWFVSMTDRAMYEAHMCFGCFDCQVWIDLIYLYLLLFFKHPYYLFQNSLHRSILWLHHITLNGKKHSTQTQKVCFNLKNKPQLHVKY